MAELKAFLSKMAQDGDLKAKYSADPAATMKSSGLSQEDITAVLSGDRATIAARLGGHETAGLGVSVNITVTLGITT